MRVHYLAERIRATNNASHRDKKLKSMAFMYGKSQPCIVKYVYKRQYVPDYVPDINIFKIWEKLI